jgi:hypothetical protein
MKICKLVPNLLGEGGQTLEIMVPQCHISLKNEECRLINVRNFLCAGGESLSLYDMARLP